MNPKVKVDKETEDPSETIRNLVKSVVSKMGPQYTAQEKKEHAKLLVRIFEKGLDPYEAMKLTQEDIAHMYLFAYRLFNAGQYIEAAEVFKMLTLLMPSEPGFATSLGVCYHKLNNFEAANRCYLIAAFLDIKDPVPLFYCYDSHLNMHDTVGAGVMLSNTVARCGDNPKYAKLKERCVLLLEGITKEIEGRKKINEKPQ